MWITVVLLAKKNHMLLDIVYARNMSFIYSGGKVLNPVCYNMSIAIPMTLPPLGEPIVPVGVYLCDFVA